MSYKTWAEESRCWECGKKPSRKDYIRHLEEEVERWEAVARKTPEEFAAWKESQETQASWISDMILDEVRFPGVMRPFFRANLLPSKFEFNVAAPEEKHD